VSGGIMSNDKGRRVRRKRHAGEAGMRIRETMEYAIRSLCFMYIDRISTG
jgi:hypothetical protein